MLVFLQRNPLAVLTSNVAESNLNGKGNSLYQLSSSEDIINSLAKTTYNRHASGIKTMSPKLFPTDLNRHPQLARNSGFTNIEVRRTYNGDISSISINDLNNYDDIKFLFIS